MDLKLVDSLWGRRILFLLLYISEGAPIGFIWWALPTQMSSAGVDTSRIAELAGVLVLPWVFKLFWAPMIDMLQFPKFTLRGWIVFCQIGMGLCLLPVASLDFVKDFDLIRNLLIVHAVFAATQDVSIDAWAIRATEGQGLGSINGFMQTGMLMGRWLFSSGYLLLASTLTQSQLVTGLVALIWATSLVVIWNPDPNLKVHSRQTFSTRFFQFHERLFLTLKRPITWLGLFYAATAGLGYNGAIAVLGDYFLKKGLNEAQVAQFFSLNIVFLLLGSLLGGFAADRFGRRVVSGTMVLLMALQVVAISYLGVQTRVSSVEGLEWAFQFLHLEIGIFVASTYGLLMEITDPELGATQYSGFMGAINLCESWAALGFARIFARTQSYETAFLVFAAVSLASFLVLQFLKKPIITPDPKPELDVRLA